MSTMKLPVHEMYGIGFTEDQWVAVRANPPVWKLNPPQREEYESDEYYAIGVLEYAKRVVSFFVSEGETIPLKTLLARHGHYAP